MDDGTGVIQCYQWSDEEQQVTHFSLGQLVMVTGRITVFRDDRQIQIDTMGRCVCMKYSNRTVNTPIECSIKYSHSFGEFL